jgi:outer membrane receptor protein involved in Fe transport
LTYTAHGGTYFGLGVDYEGKNNSYLQPPLAIVDFTFRRPVTKSLELLVSAENLLNTNNYNNLPIPGGGVDTVAATSSGLTSYTQTLIPTPPRTIRAQLRLHVGR